MARVLIVDDDARVRDALTIGLSEAGHNVQAIGTASEALAAVGSTDVVLLDLGLPDRHGLDVLPDLRTLGRGAPVIVITADGDMGSTIKAMRDGAFDYIHKPLDLDALEQTIERAVDRTTGNTKPALATRGKEPAEKDDAGLALVGESAAIRDVFKTLGLLAASRVTVLIRGESGTGKELAARALHKFSSESSGPFVAVSCAALPGPLVEAELFGYKRGAFTGADRDRAGKLEAAGEGTLFLDEIGEVPPETQVKLLRVLQERKFERLGETESRPFKARVIAATHRDLEAGVRVGQFREDLYFRLSVATLSLPPLRERREDIPILAQRLLEQISTEIGRKVDGLSAPAIDRLILHDWPGNVRELRNALTRAAVRARGTVISADDLELGSMDGRDAGAASVEAAAESVARFPSLDEVEREHIRRALARTRGHKGKTCDLLGISRPTLDRKIRRYKIDMKTLLGPGSPPAS
jgi:two-component system response regulator AtoC